MDDLNACKGAVYQRDVNQQIQLLKMYVARNKKEVAYQHAIKLEATASFSNELSWYHCLSIVMREFRESFPAAADSWEFQYYSVRAFLQRVTLSSCNYLMEDHLLALFGLDQAMFEASEMLRKHNSELLESYIKHASSMLCFHLAIAVLNRALHSKHGWREYVKQAQPLLLLAAVPRDDFTSVDWPEMESQMKRWGLEADYCRSQGVHVLFAMVKENISVFLNRVRQFCAPGWRKKLYQKMFSCLTKDNEVSKSFFVSYDNFEDIPGIIPSPSVLLASDIRSAQLYPESLHYLVWLGLQSWVSQSKKSEHGLQSPLSAFRLSWNYCCTVFEKLQWQNSPSDTEHLDQLDLDAFLYASVYCAVSTFKCDLENSSTNDDAPTVLPAVLTEPLCSQEQSEWWSAAWDAPNEQTNAALIQKGVDVVRVQENHGLDVRLVVLLAKTFENKAEALDFSSEATRFEARSHRYWTTALKMLQRMEEPTANHSGMFQFKADELSPSDLKTLVEEGRFFLASRLKRAEKYEEAAKAFSELTSPLASFYEAQMYMKMADNVDLTSKSNFLLKAKSSLVATKNRLRGAQLNPAHPLCSEVEEHLGEIEKELVNVVSARNACSPDGRRRPCSATVFAEEPTYSTLDDHLRTLANTEGSLLNSVLKQNQIIVGSVLKMIALNHRTIQGISNRIAAMQHDINELKSCGCAARMEELQLKFSEILEGIEKFKLNDICGNFPDLFQIDDGKECQKYGLSSAENITGAAGQEITPDLANSSSMFFPDARKDQEAPQQELVQGLADSSCVVCPGKNNQHQPENNVPGADKEEPLRGLANTSSKVEVAEGTRPRLRSFTFAKSRRYTSGMRPQNSRMPVRSCGNLIRPMTLFTLPPRSSFPMSPTLPSSPNFPPRQQFFPRPYFHSVSRFPSLSNFHPGFNFPERPKYSSSRNYIPMPNFPPRSNFPPAMNGNYRPMPNTLPMPNFPPVPTCVPPPSFATPPVSTTSQSYPSAQTFTATSARKTSTSGPKHVSKTDEKTFGINPCATPIVTSVEKACLPFAEIVASAKGAATASTGLWRNCPECNASNIGMVGTCPGCKAPQPASKQIFEFGSEKATSAVSCPPAENFQPSVSSTAGQTTKSEEPSSSKANVDVEPPKISPSDSKMSSEADGDLFDGLSLPSTISAAPATAFSSSDSNVVPPSSSAVPTSPSAESSDVKPLMPHFQFTGAFDGFVPKIDKIESKSKTDKEDPVCDRLASQDEEKIATVFQSKKEDDAVLEEEEMFCERGRLFRLTENKWLNSAVREVRILHNRSCKSYFLEIRERDNELVLKQRLNENIVFRRVVSSDRAWQWSNVDLVQHPGKPESFAVRFKEADIAKKFKEVVRTCQKQLLLNTNSPADTTQPACDSHPHPPPNLLKRKDGSSAACPGWAASNRSDPGTSLCCNLPGLESISEENVTEGADFSSSSAPTTQSSLASQTISAT